MEPKIPFVAGIVRLFCALVLACKLSPIYLYCQTAVKTMKKEPSAMTLEELWELFPIFLVAHDDRWNEYFNEIEKTLAGLFE